MAGRGPYGWGIIITTMTNEPTGRADCDGDGLHAPSANPTRLVEPFEKPIYRERVRSDPRLLIWLSPSFPVGSFAYSHGLEYATERGWVHDRATLEVWLGDLANHGSLRTDLMLLANAWQAADVSDCARLAHVNATALALQPTGERHLETVTQGTSFLATIEAAWPADALTVLRRSIGREAAYPVAVGLVGAAHNVPHGDLLDAYAVAFTSTLISAAIRLSVLGQTDGQRVLASLLPTLTMAAEAAARATLDDLGSATLRSDLASAAHETQYTRLFRS